MPNDEEEFFEEELPSNTGDNRYVDLNTLGRFTGNLQSQGVISIDGLSGNLQNLKVPGMKIKKIWENATYNTTTSSGIAVKCYRKTSFAAQSISVNWQPYEHIIIVCSNEINDATRYQTSSIICTPSVSQIWICQGSHEQGNSNSKTGRMFQFRDGEIYAYAGSKNGSDNNNCMVPGAIYGIKIDDCSELTNFNEERLYENIPNKYVTYDNLDYIKNNKISLVTSINNQTGKVTTNDIFAKYGMELLWENTAPNSGFSYQTISCPWEWYDALYIISKGNGTVDNSAKYSSNLIFPHQSGEAALYTLGGNNLIGTSNNANVRGICFYMHHKMSFLRGYEYNNSESNYASVPLFVYGIRNLSKRFYYNSNNELIVHGSRYQQLYDSEGQIGATTKEDYNSNADSWTVIHDETSGDGAYVSMDSDGSIGFNTPLGSHTVIWVVSNDAYDITNYNKLITRVQAHGAVKGWVGVVLPTNLPTEHGNVNDSNAANSPTWPAVYTHIYTAADKTRMERFELDVSSLSGSYKVIYCIQGSSSVFGVLYIGDTYFTTEGGSRLFSGPLQNSWKKVGDVATYGYDEAYDYVKLITSGTSESNKYGYIYSTVAIDLTNYSSVDINVYVNQCISGGYVGFSKTIPTSITSSYTSANFNAYTHIDVNKTAWQGNKTIDVSTLSGTYYFGMYCGGYHVSGSQASHAGHIHLNTIDFIT